MLEQMNPREAVLMSCFGRGGAMTALHSGSAVRNGFVRLSHGVRPDRMGWIGEAVTGPAVCAEPKNRANRWNGSAVYQSVGWGCLTECVKWIANYVIGVMVSDGARDLFFVLTGSGPLVEVLSWSGAAPGA